MGAPTGPAAPLGPRAQVAAWLSFVSGYADVVSFIRFGSFAGMMTGEMLLLGKTLINEGGVEALYNLAVMGSNMVGVVAFCAIQDAHPASATRWAAPGVAALVVAADALDAFAGSSKWHVCLLACSLGAMNFLSFTGKVGSMTALATGNLQKTAKGLFKLVTKGSLGADRDAVVVAAIVVLGTIVGAIVGAAVEKHEPWGKHWVLVPVAVLQLVVLSAHDAVFSKDGTEPPKVGGSVDAAALLEDPAPAGAPHTEEAKDHASDSGLSLHA